jgi:hypothetical protein
LSAISWRANGAIGADIITAIRGEAVEPAPIHR